MSNIVKKQEEEKQAVAKMIELYCHKHHHSKELCEQCEQLKDYAFHRIEVCPFMEKKTFCSNCNIHCYEINKREKIREVMRFSGWRMLFHNPRMAIHHVIASRKEKKKI